MNDIRLHIPEYNELWYRRKLLADPDTMSYNKGYGDVSETGCIDFTEDKWRTWYDKWIRGSSGRFYAYIVLDREFIGEICLYKKSDKPHDKRYDMGIVIESRYRGSGYSAPALALLLEQAFEKLGAESVHNEFQNYRAAALRSHLNAGFSVDGEDGEIMRLSITANRYFDRNSA